MNIEERNLGEIEVREDKIINFEEGMPGFEELKNFILLEDETGIFYYLQSTDNTDISFVLTDPYRFKKDYAPIINESYFAKLGGGDNEDFILYAVTCIQNPIEESTLNLAGPVLIHIGNMKGVQVITEDKMYTTRHRLVDLVAERG